MAVAIDPHRSPPAAGAKLDAHRWSVLGAVALAQLTVALDATIVSTALPSAKRALHAPDAGRQWVFTAYTPAFGRLLIVGGRVADSAGRKRAFLAGLAGFAITSALGGAAPALPAVTFTDPRQRARAFAGGLPPLAEGGSSR